MFMTCQISLKPQISQAILHRQTAFNHNSNDCEMILVYARPRKYGKAKTNDTNFGLKENTKG